MAIVAFVLAILGVCPLVGFCAMILGCIANWRLVGRSEPRRGRGLALWAIGIGSGTTLIWMLLWSSAQVQITGLLERRIETRIDAVIAGAMSGDVAAVQAEFDPTSQPTEAAVEAFATDLLAAGLEIRGISVSNFAYLSGALIPRSRADVQIELADGRPWTGSVTMIQRPVAGDPSEIDDVLSLERLVSQPMIVDLGLIGPSGRRLELQGTVTGPIDGSDYTGPQSNSGPEFGPEPSAAGSSSLEGAATDP